MPDFIIPKEVHLGYQKRSDTFSDKLGFITYKDTFGVMKFEKSWEGWRDKLINSDVFQNVPTEGFVLNKNSGRQWGNFERAEFVRIFDPRGFEFEISTDNLMQIILHNGISKGNGVEGKCVYGWHQGGRKVVLIPVDCKDYKRHLKQEAEIQSGSVKVFDKATDIIEGHQYKFKNGRKYTYLGKFKVYNDIYDLRGGYSFSLMKGKQFIFVDDKGTYYTVASFAKVTHLLGKNETINDIMLDFHGTPFITGIVDSDIPYSKMTYTQKKNYTLTNIY